MGRYTGGINWIDTIALLCLGLFGLFILLTINSGLFVQQFIFLAVGFVILWLTSRVQPQFYWWFAPFGYVISLFFLILTYFSPEIRGAARWITVFGIQFQPSELVKPLVLLAIARFISQFPPRKIRYLPFHIIIFLIPFLLVFKQPDLGSSIVYFVMWFAMMLAGGLPISVVVVTALGGSVLLPWGWHALEGYQKARILTFVNPDYDPQGAGYNAVQAMIAVGSGQLFGRGLGRGTQSHLRFLPEYHTDFIFATLIEELGLIGGLALISVYGFFLWRLLAPLLRGKIVDIFPYTYSVGLFGILLTQLFVNVGMNMGLIPITGITLPFVSYGGSSILSISISIGILWAIVYKKTDGQSIAIR